jgi:glucose/arabinose dehydrogenase
LRLEQLEERSLLTPTILDPTLGVRAVATGIVNPTTMAFLGPDDFLVLEKGSASTGTAQARVLRVVVVDGIAEISPVLSLPVNYDNDRGLLGIALDPDFVHDNYVYLDWTESNTGHATNVVGAVDLLGHRVDRYVWTGSALTFDRNLIHLRAVEDDVGEAGPNADSYGGVLRFGPDGKLYVYMGDADRRGWLQNVLEGHGPNGHDDQFGGPEPDDAHLTGVILRLNPDGSTPDDNPFVDVRNTFLATLTGANAEPTPGGGSFAAFLNQAMDTLTVTGTFHGLSSPTLAAGASINFRGPTEDGPAILTLPDFPQGLTSGEFRATLTKANFISHSEVGINTFADAVKAVLAGNTSIVIHTVKSPTGDIRGQITQASGEVTDNIHKIFAYGFRNGFGMAFDPYTGRLWQSENGEASFDHLTYIDAGQNAGWTQIMGPAERVPEWKAIEVSDEFRGDWQRRFPPELLADTPDEALNRLFMLPGAHYHDPEFSWRYDVPPAAVGFMAGSALGSEYAGNLFLGSAQINTSAALEHGDLMRFQFSADRTEFALPNDPYIVDKVAENRAKNDGRGSKQLIFGTDFGLVTDIQTGPNGNLYVVSITNRAIYEIYRRDAQPEVLATRSTPGFTIGIIGDELTVNCDNTSRNTVTVDHVGSTTLINLIGFSDSSFRSIRINGGLAGTTENLRATVKPITVFNSALDTVNVGDAANSVQRIQAALTLENPLSYTTLNINDSGDPFGRTVTLDSFQPPGDTRFGQITGLAPAPITYEYLDTEAVTVWTGAGGVTMRTLAVDSTSTFTSVIGDGRATNTIVGSDAANTFLITGADAGTISSSVLRRPVIFSSFQNLTGGAGNNTFHFADGARVTGAVAGRGGTNKLDYSAYSSSVIVDLLLGTATGVGGTVSNIQNVVGGSGGGASGAFNILVGVGGNVLTGGDGRRNLLIAGASASTLQGGNDEDILIGGTTAYDTDLGALLAIMDEWTGIGDYWTRVDNLLAGTGVPLLDATTVWGNGGGNQMTGGPGLDLFYGSLTRDTTDRDPDTEVFIVVDQPEVARSVHRK